MSGKKCRMCVCVSREGLSIHCSWALTFTDSLQIAEDVSHTNLGFIQNPMPDPPTAFVRINWNPVLVLLMEVFPERLHLMLEA